LWELKTNVKFTPQNCENAKTWKSVSRWELHEVHG
jgi:hypothetical protein